jgi:uncharacterized coiled-coil protein SlyX
MGQRSSAFWPWVIAAGAVLFGLAMLDGSCRADRKYRDARADYEEGRAIAEADHAMSLERIDALEKDKATQDAVIAEKDVKVAQYVEELSTLRGELTDLQDAEPAQPELEREPLVINLRAQIATLTRAFSLSQEVVAEREGQIAAWSAKYDAQAQISAEWMAAYEREHALRLAAEGLFKLGERRAGLNKTITKVALGVGAASLIYGLLK